MSDRPTHIVEFDEAELICRMVEAFAETERPAGLTAGQAVDAMPPFERRCWMRVSEAIKDYWDETIFDMKRIQ
jgi:hypothetical protein